MQRTITKEIVEAVKEVETALIEGNYKSVAAESRPSRLSESEIETAIKEYGGTITKCPNTKIENLKIIEIGDMSHGKQVPSKWFVDLDLYIDEKQSDLTLSLHVVKNDDGTLLALVDNLHSL